MPINIVNTHEEIEALAEAMAQLLDDMGKTGQSVCLSAKAQARLAYQPFIDEPEWADEVLMPLDEAKRIVALDN
jgi:hypothetical protein